MKLIVNVASRNEKLELGTLEYTGNKYVWTAGNLDLNDRIVSDFFQMSGLVSKGSEEGEELFAFFKDRITKNRQGVFFREKLKRLGMEEYREWEYVCKTGLRTAIDAYELIQGE